MRGLVFNALTAKRSLTIEQVSENVGAGVFGPPLLLLLVVSRDSSHERPARVGEGLEAQRFGNGPRCRLSRKGRLVSKRSRGFGQATISACPMLF